MVDREKERRVGSVMAIKKSKKWEEVKRENICTCVNEKRRVREGKGVREEQIFAHDYICSILFCLSLYTLLFILFLYRFLLSLNFSSPSSLIHRIPAQPVQSLADRYARRLKTQEWFPEVGQREPSSEREASFIQQADALQVKSVLCLPGCASLSALLKYICYFHSQHLGLCDIHFCMAVCCL